MLLPLSLPLLPSSDSTSHTCTSGGAQLGPCVLPCPAGAGESPELQVRGQQCCDSAAAGVPGERQQIRAESQVAAGLGPHPAEARAGASDRGVSIVGAGGS